MTATKKVFYRHLKSNGLYQVLGNGIANFLAPVADMAQVAVAAVGTEFMVTAAPAVAGQLTATFQVQQGSKGLDLDVLVVYRGEDAKVWVRPKAEFEDGRFQLLDENFQPVAPDAPPPTEPPKLDIRGWARMGRKGAK